MADNVLLTFRITANGHCRIFREKDAQMWDDNAGDFGSVTTVTPANAAIGITYTANHKVGVVQLPSGMATKYGRYKILLYNATAAAAAAGDEAVHIFIVDYTEYGIQVIEDQVLSVSR